MVDWILVATALGSGVASYAKIKQERNATKKSRDNDYQDLKNSFENYKQMTDYKIEQHSQKLDEIAIIKEQVQDSNVRLTRIETILLMLIDKLK